MANWDAALYVRTNWRSQIVKTSLSTINLRRISTVFLEEQTSGLVKISTREAFIFTVERLGLAPYSFSDILNFW